MADETKRRTAQTTRGHAVFVTPPAPMSHAEWREWVERRALELGFIAVINGRVVEPAAAGTAS